MDSSYNDQYNEYVGAEGGLFVAKEFRLSRSTYLLLALTQQVNALRSGIFHVYRSPTQEKLACDMHRVIIDTFLFVKCYTPHT
jgi:hypothetical protein